MDVLAAIAARRSIREFAPTPVPKETLMGIMRASMCSPSGSNSQPWEIYLATGAALGRIRKAFLDRGSSQAGGPPRPTAPAPGAPQPPAVIAERGALIRRERMALLGLDSADPASGRVFTEIAARMFGAPAVAYLYMHEALSRDLDMGLLIQTICLAAQGYGVESMIAGSFGSHQDVLRAELGIPPEEKFVTGIGLGYADPKSVLDTYISPRRPVEEVVRWRE